MKTDHFGLGLRAFKRDKSLKPHEYNRLEKRVERLEERLKPAKAPEMDVAVQRQAKELLKLIEPKDPVGLSFERVGQEYDGGYIMAEIAAGDAVAYSLGINRDVSWDKAMANRGFQIFQYDHTISKLPEKHPNFHFKKLGITSPVLAADELTSLPAEFRENGHETCREMTLKMDIEGHEWDVFAEMDTADLQRFRQILMEVHDLNKLHKPFWSRKARQALRNLHATHQVVHVHGNNNSPLRVLGGIAMPQTMELTWLRRDICEFTTCTRRFPTPLDQPNNPNNAEHHLGSFCFS
ncbi:hypothetical protein E1162_04440 [Rhodobacteraceae bacterium RKSG542]|uniref:FkbM family methyltransferase n=1 Tax=Pseudovibrio flavus TaxID=2529854 RepID=UPI0012BBA7DC|nr:FkbM family methyltransferase [Pseudovibrio flavus]MTI16486.1 hypothetical protein [Pseudovibrio flavus]